MGFGDGFLSVRLDSALDQICNLRNWRIVAGGGSFASGGTCGCEAEVEQDSAELWVVLYANGAMSDTGIRCIQGNRTSYIK